MREVNMIEVNMIQIYLLAVGELRCRMEKMASTKGKLDYAALPGWDKLDDWQQEKISRCAWPGTAALCMGGQLLLQYGAYEWSSRATSSFGGTDTESTIAENTVSWRNIDFSRLIEGIPAPQSLTVAYESKGKPYIFHMPWHYNLSHSRDYVALAISDAPVGIDIQEKRPYTDSLVKRFFSEAEAAAYEGLFPATDRETLFYTFWCRKEAYGKLLGTGLTEDVLKRNMLKDVSVHLYEYGELPGYCICVCSGEG